MQLKFHTNLSKDECVKILNDSFKPKLEFHDLVGKVKDDSFRFWKPLGFLRFAPGNFFLRREFSGKLQAVTDGTEIVGKLVHWTIVNMILLFGWIIITLFLSLAALGHGNVIGAILGIIFIIASIGFGSDKDGPSIDFIKKTLDASEVN